MESNLNAVIMAFALQRTKILDSEGVFGVLIDAVADTTRGITVGVPARREWAQRFLRTNRAKLDQFACAFADGSYVNYASLAAELILEPLPEVIALAAAKREVYDVAIVAGLEGLGLHLVELDPEPDKLLFHTVWAGHDGGRLEVHEHDGLPIHVVTIDVRVDRGKEITLRKVMHLAARNDPELDAAGVVAAAGMLWQ